MKFSENGVLRDEDGARQLQYLDQRTGGENADTSPSGQPDMKRRIATVGPESIRSATDRILVAFASPIKCPCAPAGTPRKLNRPLAAVSPLHTARPSPVDLRREPVSAIPT
ncbi:hypothetical protein ACVBEG_27800 [Pseudomonas sp. GG8]